MNSPSRILLIRLSAIGDVVMASALVSVLRRNYPHAHITWLTEPAAAPLLEAHPLLNEVLIWPRAQWQTLWRHHQWGQLWRQYRVFSQDLRTAHYDLVLDLQGLLKSGFWAWRSKARYRIGLGSKEGSAVFMTQVVSRETDSRRIGAEYFQLAQALNWDVSDYTMNIALTEPEQTQVQNFIAHHGPYAVFCPATTRAQKHWFEERWAALATQISTRYGLQVVLLGGPADREAAARIVAQTPTIIDLTGQTRLRESAAYIHGAALVIGVDTGLTHMGIAYGVPTLALFGSTCPYLDTMRPNARVLYHPLPCSPCRRRPTCGGEFTCMRDITLLEVITAADDVLRA